MAVTVEDILADQRVLGASLQTVADIVAERVAGDRPISPGQSAQVRPCPVVSHEIPDEARNSRTGRARVHVAGPIDEETTSRGPVHDAVVGEPEPVEVVLIQMKQSAAANMDCPVDIVLINRDVDPVVIEKDTV